jgi:hypothetical protein
MDGYLAQKRLHSAVPAARRAQAAPQFLALRIRLQLSTSSKLTRLCANGWHRNLLAPLFNVYLTNFLRLSTDLDGYLAYKKTGGPTGTYWPKRFS